MRRIGGRSVDEFECEVALLSPAAAVGLACVFCDRLSMFERQDGVLVIWV